jgi:GTP-binding protein
MHLSILIETMRREGYEFQVSTPRVLYKEIDGVLNEPIERFVADVPEDMTGPVFAAMGNRKGTLMHMSAVGTRMRLEFAVPSRGLFGYKSEFLTDTKGQGIMNTVFFEYEPYKGDMQRRNTGSLVAFETGEAVTYGLFNAQGRGTLFITPGTPVYEGMVIGYTNLADDINVNVCKTKHLTNTRSSGSDDALTLVPVSRKSLEECLEFIADDELLEVTPKSLRIRKRILDSEQRAKARFRDKNK